MQTEAVFESIADHISIELEQAESSIYIAVAWLTNRKLFNILLEKAQQGITVQLMLSNDHINEQSYVDYSQLDILNSAAYLIGDGKKDLMHNKFCVIDSNTVINGSYNWSYKAEKNHENILITKGDRVLADQFVKQFKKIRNTYFDHQEDTPDLPLDKIVKRLEIIKNYVVLEDIEDITRENGKLKVYAFQQDIAAITQALQQHSFETAITLIDLFIKNHHALVIYNDIDISALKLEIRQLEHQLNAYDNEKIELEQLCSEFYHRHTQELGSYISRLLHLRKIFTKDNPEQYAEAVQNEKDYNEKVKFESEKTIYKLDDNQRLELKRAYRQASQICHPDRVNEGMKDIAQELFIQLNQAYKKNDLAEVQSILSELNQGIFQPRSDTVTEKDQLKVILQTLKYKIGKAEEEIIAIKDSEDYQTISHLSDWNVYFEEVKAQLIEEIDYLENKAKPKEENIFSDDQHQEQDTSKDNGAVSLTVDRIESSTTSPEYTNQAKPIRKQSTVLEENQDTSISQDSNLNNYLKGKWYWLLVLASLTLVLVIIIVGFSYFS